jgi:hypothetical protein
VYVTCYLLPLLLLSNASTLDATDCDMINGGWELVMRFAPQSTFVWDSPYWTNNLTFGDTQTLSPDSSTDAKFPSMLYTNVHEIRGCLGTGLTSSNCKNYSDFGSGGYSSTQNIFASVPVGTPAQGALTFQETDAEMQGCGRGVQRVHRHDPSKFVQLEARRDKSGRYDESIQRTCSLRNYA